MRDLLIVGGGINGTAIAREAALNGWSVHLVERGDLAGATSSASSGLIHGGLRYLEFYEFRLVREALVERERLLKLAPHLIRPLTFVMPHANALRPWWILRAGLFLYDLLAWGTSLPFSRRLRAGDAAYRAPLADQGPGFVYPDARVDDARLTVLNAVDARLAGAEIVTRNALVAAERHGDVWRAELSDGSRVEARAIVNAAGPWVTELLSACGVDTKAGTRLVKGSHIVVPQLYPGDHAYTLQQPDRRIVFAIPWHGATVIGTTDVQVERPEDARIEPAEIAYLCEAANRFFVQRISPIDVIATWSGVRPLYDDQAEDASQVTRDYVLEVDAAAAPLLSIFGGKITTARALAEEAVEKLAALLDAPFAPATRTRPLPGGDLTDVGALEAEVAARWPFVDSVRLVNAYGTRTRDLLRDVQHASDMGEAMGAGLTEREVVWMIDEEWAQTAEDVLRRFGPGRTADSSVRARVATLIEARQAIPPITA
ncbi:MAG: glycerol-3-phosphate dehydrogenase [Sphingomonadales bacterium]|nr:MAG: glycerol-3-phosphate dehydrogenase [Sphingomonadales bacterium]